MLKKFEKGLRELIAMHEGYVLAGSCEDFTQYRERVSVIRTLRSVLETFQEITKSENEE